MDEKRFDQITKSVASGADRRSVLKRLGLGGLAAAGAAAGLAALKPQEASAALVNVVIFDVLNDLSIDVDVRNINVALQVCAVVSDINVGILSLIVDDLGNPVASLACEIQQRTGGGQGGQ